MTIGVLTLGYLVVGLALALVTMRRTRSPMEAALVMLAWPLYAPALGRDVPASADEPAQLADDVRAALSTVRDAAAGTPFADLLPPSAEKRLLDEIERAAARMRAIDAELLTLAVGTRPGTSTAALRAESDATLRSLQSSDRAAMRELVELLRALRTRIVLARHAGSPAEGPSALAHELWARIDGLGEAVALSDRNAPS